MTDLAGYKEEINENGFAIIESVFSAEEIKTILQTIEGVNSSKPTFRKTKDLFAIRQFLKEVPVALPLVFTKMLSTIIKELLGSDYFPVKSIYFDKPADSNWFVSYHQDLTISVKEKANVEGFGPWTLKQNQFGVQPPLSILQNNYTIRIHLDDTNENNGALRVIKGSHRHGIYRIAAIDKNLESEVICNVQKGGIMIMKPLLQHASGRTTNNKNRRVIHIEFSNQHLPGDLKWAELIQPAFDKPTQ